MPASEILSVTMRLRGWRTGKVRETHTERERERERERRREGGNVRAPKQEREIPVAGSAKGDSDKRFQGE
jgi:hypothetical protein